MKQWIVRHWILNKGQETKEVSPMTATAYCLERLSTCWPKEGKLKQSLADSRAKHPKRPQ